MPRIPVTDARARRPGRASATGIGRMPLMPDANHAYAEGMARLQADAPEDRWVAVTGSLGWRGRRHRKAAIRMLLGQAGGALGGTAGGTARPGGARPGGAFAWILSQAAPFLIRKADGRVLVWVWKADPELLVAMAQVQKATTQLRAARAMMPMDYDDTEDFHNPHLGEGERMLRPLPPDLHTPPFATYTWDTGTHFVTLTAVCSDRERFGTVTGSLDQLARTLRVVADFSVGEQNVLRLDP